MVALLVSILILVGGIGIAMAMGQRRPIGTPFTWGEAFVTATFVFALMLVAYGVVPNQWLLYADKELLWRSDKPLVGISSAGVKWGLKAKTLGGSGRILINYQAIRDLIAATLYIVFLAGQMILWSVWQKRGRKKPGDVEAATSRFGRPVLRKA